MLGGGFQQLLHAGLDLGEQYTKFAKDLLRQPPHVVASDSEAESETEISRAGPCWSDLLFCLADEEGPCSSSRLLRGKRRRRSSSERTVLADAKLQDLMVDLFEMLDLDDNDHLDETELKSLNLKIGMLYYNFRHTMDYSEWKMDILQDKLNPEHEPVSCQTFCHNLREALDELCPNRVEQERLVAQFEAEAQIARAEQYCRQSGRLQTQPVGALGYSKEHRARHASLPGISELSPPSADCDCTSADSPTSGDENSPAPMRFRCKGASGSLKLNAGAAIQNLASSVGVSGLGAPPLLLGNVVAPDAWASKVAGANFRSALWPLESADDGTGVSPWVPNDRETFQEPPKSALAGVGVSLRSALWPVDDKDFARPGKPNEVLRASI